MKVVELRDTCKEMHLPSSGTKLSLIHRITHFLATGEVAKEEAIPEISKAKKVHCYPLHPDTLILYGNYKNDAATRAFMKTLVGEHFHFTASGIDWIKQRWHAGTPPSYQDFADFWQQQYHYNKQNKPVPKEEWAYINFTQSFLKHNPTASHKDIISAWKKERIVHVKKAQEMMVRYRS
jgi:hypothetical protein